MGAKCGFWASWKGDGKLDDFEGQVLPKQFWAWKGTKRSQVLFKSVGINLYYKNKFGRFMVIITTQLWYEMLNNLENCNCNKLYFRNKTNIPKCENTTKALAPQHP